MKREFSPCDRSTQIPAVEAAKERVTAVGRKFEFIGKEAAIDRHQRLNGS